MIHFEPLLLARTRDAVLAASLVTLGACGGGSGTVNPLDPFSPGDAADGAAVADARTDILTTAASAGADPSAAFDDVLRRYERTVADDIVRLANDPHPYGSGTAGVGTYIDAQIRAAIALGAMAMGDTAARDVAYAQKVVDVLLLDYAHLAVYDELLGRDRSGVDTAFGIYGLRTAPESNTSLALVAQTAEERFDIAINPDVEHGFVHARIAIIDAEPKRGQPIAAPNALYDDAVEAIDLEGLRAFAYALRHDLRLLRNNDPSIAGKEDLVLLEARLFWYGLERWARSKNNLVDDANDLDDALYPDGVLDGTVGGRPVSTDPGVHFTDGLRDLTADEANFGWDALNNILDRLENDLTPVIGG